MFYGVKKSIVLLLTLLVLVAYLPRTALGQFRCTNPNRNQGYCVSIYDCPSLIEVLSHVQLTPSENRFLVNSQCQNGYGRAPHVCCTQDQDYTESSTPTGRATTPQPRRPPPTVAVSPSNGQGNVLPSPPDCGPLSLGDRIYNGKDTGLDEYPWMVLLGYTDRNGRTTLNCGGSLINQRYVLTAAHCVRGAIEEEIGPLAVIRLGEYDLRTDIDCIERDCNDKVVELAAEEIIPHPQFDSDSRNRHHDIALIRLAEDVTYTDFIKPVCLPLPTISRNRNSIEVGETLQVAGWGRTLLARQSNRKQHLTVPASDPGACADKFKSRNINLIASQLCAGGEFAKDSCDGDSGGPLMRRINGPPSRWFLEGIVSFGNRCGLEGWPAVYTRVADYADWIQATLRA